MSNKRNRQPIGRGLGSLLTTDGLNTSGSSSLNEVDLGKIEPNPNQPRTMFDEESLEELAVSIKNYGIIQPITVKEVEDDKYMIICGERRYRAAIKAGLEKIPAYIRTTADDNIMAMALLENIQRQDLSAIEISLAYQKLIDDSGMTQEELSKNVGKNRATISNYLRLLKLPAEIQVGIKNKKIDMGHARALLSIDDPEMQLAVYNRISKEDLSVREIENLAREVNEENKDSKPSSVATNGKARLPEEFDILREQLSKFFETKVQLTYNENGKGKITIPFASDMQLTHIMELLDRMK